MASNSKRTLYLVIIFILLLINIVVGYNWYNGKKTNEVITVEKQELQDEYNQLQLDLNDQLAELETYKGQNTELDAIILERENEIAEQQAKISKLFKQKNFNASVLKKAKTLISTLEVQNLNFMNQIDSLNTLNVQLNEDKAILETDLSSQKDANNLLEDEKRVLDGKVQLGSVLRADELTIKGVKIKANGVEKEMDRIKRIQKLKVCFQTGNNLIREKGEAKMYLRIITPKGTTIFNEANGSGIFSNKDGEDVRYSKEAAFDFTGSNKPICIYWTIQLTEVGKYRALVYNDGHLVGESSVVFK